MCLKLLSNIVMDRVILLNLLYISIIMPSLHSRRGKAAKLSRSVYSGKDLEYRIGLYGRTDRDRIWSVDLESAI